eukprot:351479-Chlamydomonas_euryale.AAC.27
MPQRAESNMSGLKCTLACSMQPVCARRACNAIAARLPAGMANLGLSENVWLAGRRPALSLPPPWARPPRRGRHATARGLCAVMAGCAGAGRATGSRTHTPHCMEHAVHPTPHGPCSTPHPTRFTPRGSSTTFHTAETNQREHQRTPATTATTASAVPLLLWMATNVGQNGDIWNLHSRASPKMLSKLPQKTLVRCTMFLCNSSSESPRKTAYCDMRVCGTAASASHACMPRLVAPALHANAGMPSHGVNTLACTDKQHVLAGVPGHSTSNCI